MTRMNKKLVRAWERFFADHEGKSFSDIEDLINTYLTKEARP